MSLSIEKIPQALRRWNQWVVWKVIERNGEKTKVPFSSSGSPAKSNDFTTWAQFEFAVERYEKGGYAGVGFMFSADDEFCGVDLDGCRDKLSGKVADWAREIITQLDTYAEVSPSGTGVKLFLIGKPPISGGKKKKLDVESIGGKEPAIEVYDRLRYFAVTGWRLEGQTEPQKRQTQLDVLCMRFWPPEQQATEAEFYSDSAVIERARKYLATMPKAISGSDGSKAAFRVACVLTLGFGLNASQALPLMQEWNQICEPPWTEKELLHKLNDASRKPGTRNFLRNATQERWASITLPDHQETPRAEPRLIDLSQAARKQIAAIRSGTDTLVTLGISTLDHAIGGGVAFGEMVILAARPSHGKSAVALQCAHWWTSCGMPTFIVSEEMSALALGKRTLQFISSVPVEHWRSSVPELEANLDEYEQHHAKCLIVESCGTADAACEQIEAAIDKHAVQCVIVDYAQLLRSRGATRYEQITNTSISLRQLATKHRIVLLALCQLNRKIEDRQNFSPMMSDLRDTGQLEQDADVVIMCCWPHRMDERTDPHKYQFFVMKNRNRPINRGAVGCRFEPSRQMVMNEAARIESMSEDRGLPAGASTFDAGAWGTE